MTVIYDCDPAYDTSEVARLRNEINSTGAVFSAALQAHCTRQQEDLARYAALLLEQRPAYPTREHLAGVRRIAEYVREGVEYGDHHGYPRPEDEALPDGVRFSSAYRRVNLFARAPYAPTSGRRLWEFTDTEVAAIREALSEAGLGFINEWRHEDGIAFTVRLAVAA